MHGCSVAVPATCLAHVTIAATWSTLMLKHHLPKPPRFPTSEWQAHPSPHRHPRWTPHICSTPGGPPAHHTPTGQHAHASSMASKGHWKSPFGWSLVLPSPDASTPGSALSYQTKGQPSQRGANQTSHPSSKSSFLFSSKEPRQGDNNPGSV